MDKNEAVIIINQSPVAATTTANNRSSITRALLIINCLILAIGSIGGPLLVRVYFIHGGKRLWLATFLETAAFPLILIPLLVIYLRRRKHNPSARYFLMKFPLFAGSSIVGVIMGTDNYFYTYGLARLPVSTSTIILATQLGFTAGFAYVLVKQRFTAASINAVILLTVGAAVLALRTSSDRPEGESNREYVLGFVMTLAAAALYGFALPLVELIYKKVKQEISYGVVLEFQLVMCVSASIFSLVGMIINNDFQVIGREARDYGLGEAKYYVVLMGIAVLLQAFFLGSVGVIFCASSLLSGIIIAATLPFTEILAVVFLSEKFQAEKGVALALSLWGFASYFYGEFQQNKKNNNIPPISDMPLPVIRNNTTIPVDSNV